MAKAGRGKAKMGRPPKAITDAKRNIAEAALAAIDEVAEWRAILTQKKDPRLKFEALKYLTDRRDGKAKQAIEHSVPKGTHIKVEFVRS